MNNHAATMTPEQAALMLELVNESREALLFLENMRFYIEGDPQEAVATAETLALSLRYALREIGAVRG